MSGISAYPVFKDLGNTDWPSAHYKQENFTHLSLTEHSYLPGISRNLRSGELPVSCSYLRFLGAARNRACVAKPSAYLLVNIFQGKFIRIHFGPSGKLASADIDICE